MTNEQELITVVTHLTNEEKEELRGILNSLKIEHLISGHDAKDRFNSLYYQIKVKEKDLKAARQIINRHKAKVFIDSRKCPKCKQLGHREIKKRRTMGKSFILRYCTC